MKTGKESTINNQSVRKVGKDSDNSFYDFPWNKASKGEDYHFYVKIEMCGGKLSLYIASISILYSCTMKCYISSF